MRKLCVLLATTMTVLLQAQVTIDDFESSANTWNVISCGMDIVDNPYQTGLNVSCRCLQIVRAPGCDNWSGAILYLATPINGYNYVHALMYRNNSHNPNLKITDNGTDPDMLPMTSITANQWQDVVFDISGKTQADFVFFMADRDELSEDAVVYIDDIIFSNDPTPRTTPNSKCGGDEPVNPSEPDMDGYTLVWNADFASSSVPSNWNIEVNGDGGGNNELQYYCTKGVSVAQDPAEGKHCLVLTATKENYMGKKCTSGRVNTLGNTYFQYGKIEARVWFPKTARGLWPAFWMMGNDFSSVGWPACGETDIVELGNSNGFGGNEERYFNGASHWGPDWQTHYQNANAVTNGYSVEDGFHIFTCIWTPEKVSMYVDRAAHPSAAPYYEMTIPVSTQSNAPGKYFHKPNFIIFNLAVGGNFPGIYDINNVTALADGPRSMYVDWVRVYQRGDEGESFHSSVASEDIEEEGTAVPTVSASGVPQKVLRDGKIVIVREGKEYTILGQ